MKVKIKISNIKAIDMLKFKKLGEEREKAIETSYTDKVVYSYPINELAKVLHPKSMKVMVTNIIKETNDTKTIVFKRLNNEPFPPFRAGQYVVLDAKIKGVSYKRSYSISSSPKNLDQISITVRAVRDGIVSNYLVKELTLNTDMVLEGPFGTFTYNSLRDKKQILALVGGSGITPIMSLARAIYDKVENCDLTILYGEKTYADILFKDELDKICRECENVRVKYILSDEKSSIYDTGYISMEQISEYELGSYSYFVCGPVHFYHHLDKIFQELDIPNKYIRHDIYKECEVGLHHNKYTLTVLTDNKEIDIPCYEDEPILKALENASIKAPSKCLVGVCGFCRSKLIKGKVKTDYTYVRGSDINNDYLHPCVSYPLSDVTIKLCK